MGTIKIGKIVSGLGWTFGERILAQGVSFVVSIVLARILAPSEFGIISLILIFINISNVFVSNGFGESLIQKKNADIDDYSTVFWCSFFVSFALVGIIWICAPVISNFYDTPNLTWPLRILSLKLILASINSIQQAYISKRLMFRKMFFATLFGTIVSAFGGIALAYLGFGVWALVAQYLINSTIDTVALLITIPWRPQLVFSVQAAKQLISYGWKITGAALINELYSQIRSLVIGKVYSTVDLAYYNRGNIFPQVIMTNINTAVNKVFFPVMANVNDDKSQLKKIARSAIIGTALITFPLMTFLIVAADKIILLLLTEKWMFSIPFMRTLCLFWIVQPVQTVNWQILKATGRSDLCLKLEIIKKIIGVGLVISTMMISVQALAWSNVAFAMISMIVNMIPNRKLINYSIFEQILDLLPITLLSFGTAGIAWLISFISLPLIISISLEAVVCFGVYGIVLTGYLKIKQPSLMNNIISKIIRGK